MHYVFCLLQVIRTVTASVATVPVSLATVSTCNPVSGNSVSIAGCPTVSIAQPAQILAPSQQILGKCLKYFYSICTVVFKII